MTYDVNVPDGATRMHDAIVRLPLCLLADSPVDKFAKAGLVIRMNPLKEFFKSGKAILGIETQNTVAFLRPVPDILIWIPCPTPRLTEPLTFCKKRLTGAQVLLRVLAYDPLRDRVGSRCERVENGFRKWATREQRHHSDQPILDLQRESGCIPHPNACTSPRSPAAPVCFHPRSASRFGRRPRRGDEP